MNSYLRNAFRLAKCLVEIASCNSHALHMLGSSQLEQYENDPDSDVGKQFLEEAMASFKASIAMEGKSTAGSPQLNLRVKTLMF